MALDPVTEKATVVKEVTPLVAGDAKIGSLIEQWHKAKEGEGSAGNHDTRGEAIAECERAPALNYADFLVERAEALVHIGRPEYAIAQIEKALLLNPHLPEWHLWTLGRAYLVAGRYEEALATLRRMNNPFPGVRKTLARVYERLGRLEKSGSTE